jgi:hypothetical protein
MLEPLAEFQCYVGKYEIRRRDELPPPKGDDDWPDPPPDDWPNMPQLVQVGPAKLVKPKRDALKFAVGLLLKTPMPKWYAGRHKREYHPDREDDLDFDIFERRKPVELDAQEFSRLQTHVLQIARAVGMVRSNDQIAPTPSTFESLGNWIELLILIRRIFNLGRRPDFPPQSVGHLDVLVSPNSLQIRPSSTYTALIYCAAEMVARGTTVRKCDNCGTPFPEGGERASRNKKRAGARFCSDKCRYDFHNEVHRKKRLKAKAKS